MARGSVRRRTGGESQSSPNGTLPRPIADISKLSIGDSRTVPIVEADLSFPRARPNVALVYPGGRRRRPQVLAKPPLTSVKSLRRKPRRVLEALLGDPRVSFCAKRKERREVLFAMKRAGYRGSVKKKSWRRTFNSQWRC